MDRLTIVVVVALVHVFLFSIHEIRGIEGRTLLSTENNVKTNATDYDEIYDCVDFYKQPAFNHPLLANHTFYPEMRPSFVPEMMGSKTTLSVDKVEVQFRGKGCPVGTVPIRRITEENRIKERLLSKNHEPRYKVSSTENPGTHYAMVKTKMDAGRKYYGGCVDLSIWNPYVEHSQYSSGQIVIRNNKESIQVGWTVGATKCFNTYCPGFVLVNKDFAIDTVLEDSRSGGPTYFTQLMIYKGVHDGHWWLTVGRSSVPIGFWPKAIFTELSDNSTSVEWGGQVFSPTNLPSPPMGGGLSLRKDSKVDAYCGLVRTITENFEVVDADNIEPNVDSDQYEVAIMGSAGGALGNLVFYGGPGGAVGN